MTPAPVASDPAAPPGLTTSVHSSWRWTSERRPNRLPAIVTPAHGAMTLTDLSSMISRVHTIRGRGGVARDLDQRLAEVIAELESLIHDLLHDTGSAPGGTEPSSRVATSSAAGASDPTRAEAAFDAWLSSDDLPDVWPLDGPDGPPVALIGMLGELVLSRRQLPFTAAAGLGMPPGATFGFAAAELILAVNDPVGPRCDSYRTALSHLREHDGIVVGP